MNSAFRNIRPSNDRDPSASSSNPSTITPITSESTTGSDPRRAHGKQTDGTSTINAATTPLKRRRVPETVTRNACLPCKKARSKCDGKTPCKRCESRADRSECIYEVHTKHKKEELVEQLRESKAVNHLTEQIFQALCTSEQVHEIIDRLRKNESYESIVEWLGRSPAAAFETLSPQESHHSIYENSDHEMGGVNPDPFRWTTVTSDTAILDHLFQLYFAWVHPVHTLFNERRFVQSYRNFQADNFCSPVLVNAICAMACHLHSPSDGDDFDHLGEDFSEAVRAALDGDDHQVTMIQAFAVMFLVDCARANVLRAAAYLRVATKGLAHATRLETDGFGEVWKSTVCGIRNLNVEWAQVTFQVPPPILTARFEGLDDIDDIDDNADDLRKWYFYRYVGDETPGWPALLATTDREKSKLMKIINDAVTLMYNTEGAGLTAAGVLDVYARFIAWRQMLPRSIGNIDSYKSQALPHVLSLLILYSNAVIQLLRPLLDFEDFPSVLVEESIWNTAQEGLFLLEGHYRTQFTCRYQPVLQMFALLHLTDVICRFFPHCVDGSGKDGAAAMQFGMEALGQSYPGFPVAGPFQEMLQRTANECTLTLPKNRILPKQRYGMDDLIDACARPSYVQPAAEIHHRYTLSFSVDWAKTCSPHGFREPVRRLRGASAEERVAQSLMQIRNLLNTN